MSQDSGAAAQSERARASALEELRSLSIDRSGMSPVMAKSRAGGGVKWGRLVMLGLVVVVLAVGARPLWSWFQQKTAPPPETAVVIRTGGPQVVLTSTGYVNADAVVLVGSTIFGRLDKILVDKGDLVTKGQVLAELESDQLRAELALARANLKRDQRNLARQEKLFSSNATTLEALDNARSQVEADRANADLAAAKLRQTKILSPIDGKVLDRMVEPGLIVTPNLTAGILKLADMHKAVVEVEIKEGDLAKLELDQSAEVVLDAFPNKPYHGTLRELAQVADRAKATVLGKVFLTDADDAVRPGMSARITFKPKQASADPNAGKLLVPAKAMLPGGKAVFVVAGGKLERREVEVRLLKDTSDQLEIVRGLEDGERVVIGKKDHLRDGQKVGDKSTSEKSGE